MELSPCRTLTTSHHTLSILKRRTFRVARFKSPQGLHSTNQRGALQTLFQQMTTVFNRTLLQTAERQMPKGSVRSSGRRIVTRTSKPSLTSCRTSERTGSHLPFLLPHDPATTSLLVPRCKCLREKTTTWFWLQGARGVCVWHSWRACFLSLRMPRALRNSFVNRGTEPV